jgi:putative ABC transport system substrate-binding protein
MRRRAFIAGLGSAAAWPLAARAQQRERMRRIGVLHALASDDPQSQRRMTAFVQGLQQLGWTDGRNVLIETRYGTDGERLRRYAAELVALRPDVIVASTTSSMVALQQATSTVPIVFVQVSDAVGAGFAESMSRPGGNATGLPCFPTMASAPNGWSCSSGSFRA